ncbi:hypothetical protein I33_2904 [Bacillus subtilis subsp. subtilis str. RO-NN-1]|nr:hypothetical protein I33_2904 [Bacillus subtilis subsp. subtilis str. RO-NN-1]
MMIFSIASPIHSRYFNAYKLFFPDHSRFTHFYMVEWDMLFF